MKHTLRADPDSMVSSPEETNSARNPAAEKNRYG